MNFKELNDELKPYWTDILFALLPGGMLIGNEYTCADLSGGKGQSLKFNINTGLWADFASEHKGADIISIYAAANGMTQFDAYAELEEKYLNKKPQPTNLEDKPKWGKPSLIHEYKNQQGDILGYVCRYDTANGKLFVPYTKDGDKWVKKMLPAPRPLYGLDRIGDNNNILIVEGEKAADAAQEICGRVYSAISWSNGVKSIHKTDWSPIYGKNVLIWPDADAPGVECSQRLYEILISHCKPLKILNVGTDKNGWDAADALADGWNWDKFKAWAVPIAQTFEKSQQSIKKPTEIKPESRSETRSIPQHNHTTIFNIMSDTSEEEFSSSHYNTWEKLGLSLNRNGGPDLNNLNVLKVLNGLPKFKDMIWYDPFYSKIRTLISPPNHPPLKEPREWQDEDDSDLVTFLQGELGFRKISESLIYKVVKQFARSNMKNEPKDWFNSLEWDGVDRIDTFFSRCLGAEDSKYTRAVSKNFFISMVARVFNPGCQLDSMAVLEGSQGLGKTSILRILGGKWHCEAQENVTSNNFFQVLQGKLIVEISELSSFPSQEVNRIKQVISCPVDRYRTPYDKHPKDQPRSSIFCATTNEKYYLHDPTGARRFWPVMCGKIDKEIAIRERDLLFAEAVYRYKNKEAWHIVPKDQAQEEQEGRRHKDTWEDVVKAYVLGRSSVTNMDLFVHGLQVKEIHRIDVRYQRRMNVIMTKIGWEYQNGAWHNSSASDSFDVLDGWN